MKTLTEFLSHLERVAAPLRKYDHPGSREDDLSLTHYLALEARHRRWIDDGCIHLLKYLECPDFGSDHADCGYLLYHRIEECLVFGKFLASHGYQDHQCPDIKHCIFLLIQSWENYVVHHWAHALSVHYIDKEQHND